MLRAAVSSMDEILLKDKSWRGRGPPTTDHLTFKPSLEDQLAIHAVQEKVLFISQRYCTLDFSLR
jgi:hypothetical protein